MPERAFVRRCRPLLGTFVEITAPAAWEAAVETAFTRVAHVHSRMSFHEAGSDLARIARAAAGEVVAVDADTGAVLALSATLNARSGGLFDVTIAKRLVAAGFLPRPPGVDLRASTGSAADIELIDRTHVRCRRPLLIDLGGIAKGYAVDQAAEALIAAGVRSAVVNAGGDLRVIGSAPQTVHLRSAEGVIEGGLSIADAAVASSGDMRARRRHRGREVSPHFGRHGTPVLASEAVTVIAQRCAVADAMTKVALADPALANEMLSEFAGAIVARPAMRRAA